ncbi:hypothetical protein [Mycolicibacter sinensis]|uniref:Apea-like HEPN domain-containing protein n=1 Tax=Mycolicibacter sinensis (strain JDM601) TaxID=875328 RepID=A0A1A2E171_MYCSD|nr:hypothetical protein [Mycolicibacter sinensis]OBF98886.1 hypothetical protein A5772_13645 [Mycolicibacter sinensis]OBG00921.1 hypothetical protein A5771_17800 [Mycolicibacter sinensis]
MTSDDNAPQSYSFRNRFKLIQNQRLDSGDALEIPLATSDVESVVIRGAKAPEGEDTPNFVSKTDDLVLLGEEYADAGSASTAGRKWRHVLAAVLARESLGVDFGPDDQTAPHAEITYAANEDPPELFKQIGVKAGDRVIWDDGYKLTVYRTHPKPRFISAEFGTPTISLSGWLARFQERVQVAERTYAPWGNSRQLAYRLIHSALRDPNPETRHVQLVTAAETLVDERPKPADVVVALRALMSHVEDWAESPPDEAINEGTLKCLKDILREDERESITQAGAQQAEAVLTAVYRGEAPGKFFKKVYDQRSRLVHGLKRKQKRPSVEQLREVNPDLLKFVLDLLDAMPE